MPELNGRIRFGAFDFDPATGELRRDGNPVHLQPQPARVLGILLARPGGIVTREDLRSALWGTDTFVDVNRGLNFCVAQIRSALGDSIESPVYIRTIPKRGYQFIAPASALRPAEPIDTTPSLPERRRMIPAWSALAIAGLIATAMLLWHPWNRTPLRRLAIASFDNSTGDPALDPFAESLTDTVVGEFTLSGKDKYAVIGNAAILRQPRAQRDLLAIHSALQAELVVLCVVQRNAGEVEILAQLIGLPSQAHLRVSRIRVPQEGLSAEQGELAKTIWRRLALTDPPKP